MTAQRDPDALIRTFLDEGQTELPDRAFDAVRRDIHHTRQRVVIGPWREPHMSIFARVAIAAAAVVAVGFAWVNFGPSPGGGVGAAPTPTAAPTAPPTASPSPRPIPMLDSRSLEPGRYALNSTIPISVTVPAGWSSLGRESVKKDGEAEGAGFGIWDIGNTFVDACTDHTPVSPAPGSGVDELAERLANQPGVDAGPLTDVTIDGYSGTSVELTVTTDITTCIGGRDGFWLWAGSRYASDPHDYRYVQDTNEMDRIYVLDVDGVRFTLFARVPPGTTAAARAELEAIIDSIEIGS